MEDQDRHIVSLATVSPGWRAIYRHGDGYVTREVTAWALVEDEGSHAESPESMVGIVVDHGHTEFADQVGIEGCRFCGYAGPNEDPRSILHQSLGMAMVEPSARSKAKSFASTWFG
jgi:hypothetical protein